MCRVCVVCVVFGAYLPDIWWSGSWSLNQESWGEGVPSTSHSISRDSLTFTVWLVGLCLYLGASRAGGRQGTGREGNRERQRETARVNDKAKEREREKRAGERVRPPLHTHTGILIESDVQRGLYEERPPIGYWGGQEMKNTITAAIRSHTELPQVNRVQRWPLIRH